MSHKELKESLDIITKMIKIDIHLDVDKPRFIRFTDSRYPTRRTRLEARQTHIGDRAGINLIDLEYDYFHVFRKHCRSQRKKDFTVNYVMLKFDTDAPIILEWIHNMIAAICNRYEWRHWEDLGNGVEFLHFLDCASEEMK